MIHSPSPIPRRTIGWGARAAALSSLTLAGACSALGTRHDDPRTTEVFGYSREERPIHATILGEGPETFLLLGVIHGNEPLGAPLLERFIERVREDPDLARGKRLVVVPVVNPDGLAGNSRANARGVDLNRNFPASNWLASRGHGTHPGSEPETRAVLKILRQFSPSRILAIHSPLECVNFDGPAEALARTMASAIRYPLRASIGYPTPGSLGSYAGVDRLTPTVTLELERGASLKKAWEDTYPGLVAFVQHADRREPTYAGERRAAARRSQRGERMGN